MVFDRAVGKCKLGSFPVLIAVLINDNRMDDGAKAVNLPRALLCPNLSVWKTITVTN